MTSALEQLDGDDAHVTRDGAILGTVRYMAPEQIKGREVDARSDLFSFGAVVFEMLTGRRAFDGDSAASVRAAILEHEPPPVSSLQPLVPPAIDDIVRRCLAKNPDERWQTAGDVIRELKQVFESIVQARTQAPPTGVVPKAARCGDGLPPSSSPRSRDWPAWVHGGWVPALVDDAALRPDSIRRGAAARQPVRRPGTGILC